MAGRGSFESVVDRLLEASQFGVRAQKTIPFLQSLCLSVCIYFEQMAHGAPARCRNSYFGLIFMYKTIRGLIRRAVWANCRRSAVSSSVTLILIQSVFLELVLERTPCNSKHASGTSAVAIVVFQSLDNQLFLHLADGHAGSETLTDLSGIVLSRGFPDRRGQL